MDYQVFISYRRDGGDALAGRISDRLSMLGYKVFYDVETMRSGKFNTQILDAIDSCTDFVIVLPPHGLDRCAAPEDWVRQELAYALKEQKNIIPILMKGFEFPQVLPREIDSIRFMEGVTASSDYFDAVIDKINGLLKSKKKLSINYELTDKEYYKIKTPLINPYKILKSCDDNRKLRFYLDDIRLKRNVDLKWNGLRAVSFWECDIWDRGILGEYIKKNDDRIKRIRDLIIEIKERDLKKYSLYFYAEAINYVNGIRYSFFSYTFESWFIFEFDVLLCYLIDYPYDQFIDLTKQFSADAIKNSRTKIPLPFSVLPDKKKTPFKNDEFYAFCSDLCLLYDYMTEVCLLLMGLCDADWSFRELKRPLVGQICSYYKWLKKCRLLPNKEIQEKIYKYLQF